MVSRDDFLGKLCKVGFSLSDASIYLFPYSPDGSYTSDECQSLPRSSP